MRKQQGVTVVGAILGIIVFILAAIMIMRVAPVYIKNYEVESSIKALQTLDPTIFSGDVMQNVEILKKRLIAQFDVNGLRELKEEHVVITPEESGVYKVKVAYQVIKPLFSNVSLLFDFDNSNEVHIGSK